MSSKRKSEDDDSQERKKKKRAPPSNSSDSSDEDQIVIHDSSNFKKRKADDAPLYNPGASISEDSLADFFEVLFNKDDFNSSDYIQVDLYDRLSSRVIRKKIFSVKESVWRREGFRTLRRLFEEEERGGGGGKGATTAERGFVEDIVETDVMRTLIKFLKSNGLFAGTAREFQELLLTLWFSHYSLRGDWTCGFKHVFLGEEGGSSVQGLHNWARYAEEDAKDNIEYFGWHDRLSFTSDGSERAIMRSLRSGGVISLRFKWKDLLKEKGSMFVGTSPAFEIAIYTICFLKHPQGKSYVKFGDKTFYINTIASGGNRQTIRTAYPVI